MRKKRISKTISIHFVLGITIILCMVFLSIGFSAFTSNLSVNEISAEINIQRDIRITNMSVSSLSGSATSRYEEFETSSLKSNITLPSQSSSVTYEVSITNIGNVKMGILSIDGLPNNLDVSLTNYSLTEPLCDNNNPNNCKLGSVTTFLITIGYKSGGYSAGNTSYNLDLSFNFKQAYSITYVGFNNTTGLPTSILSGETKVITFNNTNGIPYLVDIVNANKSYASPVVTITNAIGDVTVTRILGITYTLNGGVNPSDQVVSFLTSSPETILNASHPHDATFDGWYQNSGFTGTSVTSTSGFTNDLALYAKWIGDIPNTTYSNTNYRFTANNVSSGIVLNTFISGTQYHYSHTAKTTINSVTLYVDYYSSNKSGGLTCQIASGSNTGTTSISFQASQRNGSTNGTITLSNPIQVGEEYTISCTEKSGDNNNKIKVQGFAFIINP